MTIITFSAHWRSKTIAGNNNSFSRNVINLITFESKSVNHLILWPITNATGFVYFRERRIHRCCRRCHAMRNSNCVEPEIIMADVKPKKTCMLDCRSCIGLLFCRQRNSNDQPHISRVQQHDRTGLDTSDVAVTGISKMAAINRKYIYHYVNLSLYIQ